MPDLIVDFAPSDRTEDVNDVNDVNESDQTDDVPYARPKSMRDLIVDFKHRRSSYKKDIKKAEDEDGHVTVDVTAYFDQFKKQMSCRETKSSSKSESSQVQVEVADDGLGSSLTEYFYSNQWAENKPTKT